MGAENSILTNVEWTEKYSDTGQDWNIENGELENGIEISMFTVSKKEHKQRDFLRRLAKVALIVYIYCHFTIITTVITFFEIR